MTWLITGGAGYIGAHVVRAMLDADEQVVVYDDLSTGVKERLPDGVELIVGSVLDRSLLDRTLAQHRIDGVIHIAGKKQVAESVQRPLLYYLENVEGTRTLLEAVTAAGVRRFAFSSSAAVYGETDDQVVTEDTRCSPQSPYGESKLVCEWMVRDAARAHGLGHVNLRYFNVAGAATPELADTGVFNLIPMVFERLSAGEAPRIFGDDYPTPDGTCVRDYIDVRDIASAHVAAARHLTENGEDTALTLNAGRGEGLSVRQMITTIRSVTGVDVEPVVTDRRPGDAPVSIAAANRIREALGWTATHGVEEMTATAWAGWRHHHGSRTA